MNPESTTVNATRIQTATFLLLLVVAQLLSSVHDVSHVSVGDDQACSLCLHGKPKQHAAMADPLPAPAHASPLAPDTRARFAVRYSCQHQFRPRGPPLSA